MDFSHIMFRRQFLMICGECNFLVHWKQVKFNKHTVYAHPDLGLKYRENTGKNTRAVLIGDLIDPYNPQHDNSTILDNLLQQATSIEEVYHYLHPMGGRYVLIVDLGGALYVIHDPCGLRSVYYTFRDNQIYLASQPALFEHVFPLVPRDDFHRYHQSRFKHHPEPWLPSGHSLYEGVYHLVPNHYLQVSILKQVRYWPREKLQSRQFKDGAVEAAMLLKKLMHAGNARYQLALPLTSGWDSRMLLAASRDITNDIYFYTLLHEKTKKTSSDIKIPRKLGRSLGFTHYLIDCMGDVSPEFSVEYHKSYMAHACWEKMAYGMQEGYPAERVCVKGNCSEICRGFFRNHGIDNINITTESLVSTRKGWRELPFIYDQLDTWLADSLPIAKECNIDILDLFYWEHRMGSWQAQYQLEFDTAHECYTPYNHRVLVEVMLGVPEKYRLLHNRLYLEMMNLLWPEVLSHPINPPSSAKAKTYARLKETMYLLGVGKIAKRMYRSVYPKKEPKTAKEFR